VGPHHNILLRVDNVISPQIRILAADFAISQKARGEQLLLVVPEFPVHALDERALGYRNLMYSLPSVPQKSKSFLLSRTFVLIYSSAWGFQVSMGGSRINIGVFSDRNNKKGLKNSCN